MQAIGIFGGTFDPIHHGHLRLAEEIADAFDLREVRFIPTGQPPHRAAPQASAPHRLEMVRRAIEGNPRFVLDDREIRAVRVSYTLDTLRELRSELGEQQPLCLLLGADAFLGLAGWHEWQNLFELAHIVVALRPGSNMQQGLPEALQREVDMRLAKGEALTGAAGSVRLFDMTPLAISASSVRHALAHQRSVRYLVPDGVLDYFQQQQLYKP